MFSAVNSDTVWWCDWRDGLGSNQRHNVLGWWSAACMDRIPGDWSLGLRQRNVAPEGPRAWNWRRSNTSEPVQQQKRLVDEKEQQRSTSLGSRWSQLSSGRPGTTATWAGRASSGGRVSLMYGHHHWRRGVRGGT